MRHVFDRFPKFASGGNNGCVPDSQPVTAQKIHIGPLIVNGGAARFVKDVAAEKMPAIARDIVSYLLPQPDKAVALFTTGQVAVWRPFIVFHRRFHTMICGRRQ